MSGLRVLITNNALDLRAGTELYVRDLAIGLLERGHTPMAYSTVLGDVAKELRAATVPVANNLDALAVPPDIIHGHHHIEAMTALLHFPGVPAIYLCHGWLPWLESPPLFPRILRYVAVDTPCRDRLLLEHGIPESRIRLLLNFVDLRRFKPRGPLPVGPQRALVFSNTASEVNYVHAVRQACARAGLTLDVVGLRAGTICAQPEAILGRYDIVFARARSALEAMAVGTAVVLCDETGLGPMVTTSELDRLRPLNFGIRALRQPLSSEAITREIARYDPADAMEVSRRIRATAGHDAVIDELVALYGEVMIEHGNAGGRDVDAEGRAAAAYLRRLRTELAANAEPSLRLPEHAQRIPMLRALALKLTRALNSRLPK